MRKKRQRWSSFSLATLLALVTLLACWLAGEANRVATQRKVASRVARLCAERRLTSYDPIAFSGSYMIISGAQTGARLPTNLKSSIPGGGSVTAVVISQLAYAQELQWGSTIQLAA